MLVLMERRSFRGQFSFLCLFIGKSAENKKKQKTDRLKDGRIYNQSKSRNGVTGAGRFRQCTAAVADV